MRSDVRFAPPPDGVLQRSINRRRKTFEKLYVSDPSALSGVNHALPFIRRFFGQLT